MHNLPHKKYQANQDFQTEDYYNLDLQKAYTIGNNELDTKNIVPESLKYSNFAFQAWHKAQHYGPTGLDTITVAAASSDFDDFGFSGSFTSPEGIVNGSVTLVYEIYAVQEKNWILSGSQITLGYNSTEFKSNIHHKFAFYVDDIKVSETDYIGEGTFNTLHLPFYAPVGAGTHTFDLRVKLAQGDVLVSANQFVPEDYGYVWFYTRSR